MTLEEQRLLEALDHTFQDPERLRMALTHSSYVNEFRGDGPSDNQRLEFLGDAVIDLVVSEALMDKFPDAREGELSKMRARMVSEVALARVADRIGLGSALRLGRGEEMSGGREKASVLADAFEALVAAIYLDGGYEAAKRFVRRWIASPEPTEIDAKTELQHRAQECFKKTPRYRLVEEHGPDHDKTFVAEVYLDDETLGRGVGRSKKESEQRAAANVLARWSREAAEAGVGEEAAGAGGDPDDA